MTTQIQPGHATVPRGGKGSAKLGQGDLPPAGQFIDEPFRSSTSDVTLAALDPWREQVISTAPDEYSRTRHVMHHHQTD